MKAVAVGPEMTLEVREVPDPDPGEGEVTVRVEACGICGSDLHMLPSGALAEGSIMGHEIAGTVAAVGAGVDSWIAGDPVCVYPFAPLEHLDVAAAMGSGIGLGTNDGGYAQQLKVPAEMLWRLPAGVELAHGALIEPLAVALHGIDMSGATPVALLGMLGEPVPISQLNVMLKEVRLRGSFAYRPGSFDEAIELLAAGRVPAEELISSRRPLEDAADCFTELRTPGTSELKVLLQPAL